jgi:hypothetical protein
MHGQIGMLVYTRRVYSRTDTSEFQAFRFHRPATMIGANGACFASLISPAECFTANEYRNADHEYEKPHIECGLYKCWHPCPLPSKPPANRRPCVTASPKDTTPNRPLRETFRGGARTAARPLRGWLAACDPAEALSAGTSAYHADSCQSDGSRHETGTPQADEASQAAP